MANPSINPTEAPQSLRGREVDQVALQALSARVAHHYKVIPLKWQDDVLVLAMADPANLQKIDDIRALIQKDVAPVHVKEQDILDGLKRYYGVGADTLEALNQESPGNRLQIESADDIKIHSGEASVIKFVKQDLRCLLARRPKKSADAKSLWFGF
jgi:type II secretory ATPase GspE/PulE/Tfp pilus assembly ATPase PilB-like protein